MFGRRSDATLVSGLSRMRRMMPYISPRRNDSLVLYSEEIEVGPALRFIEEVNKSRPDGDHMTLFHLVLRALAIGIHEHPNVNRFVAGGKLWQRHGVWFTFSAKLELVNGAPLVTVKREFPADESLDDMCDSILRGLRERRAGRENRSDKEMKAALQLPGFLVRMGVWLLHKANMLGILPKSMVDDDPLFSTMFIGNLGSVNMESGYHHLWEYGTCSLFGVIGRIHERFDGKQVIVNRYTYDERMADGLAGGIAMSRIKQLIENPEELR